MPKNISRKGFGRTARTVKFCIAGAAAIGVSALLVLGVPSPHVERFENSATVGVFTTELSVASVSPAQRSLEALGISSVADLQKIEEPAGDYYIMFTDAGEDSIQGHGGKVLAKVQEDGNISLLTLSHDILPEMSPELTALVSENLRGQVRERIQEEAGIRISYYAVVDSAYLAELESSLTELKAAGDEWAAKVAEEERANLRTTIDDNLWYNQRTYEGYTYQYDYDIPTYGCGLCATTVALDMLFAKDWDPVYISDQMKAYGDEHGVQYCVNEGTSYGQWRQVVQALFEVNIRNAYSIDDVQAAPMDGKMVISGNGGEVFNDSEGNRHHHPGHIICFYKTDGSSLWAKDSAECGGPSVEYTAEDFDYWWWQGGADRTFILERSF